VTVWFKIEELSETENYIHVKVEGYGETELCLAILREVLVRTMPGLKVRVEVVPRCD